MSKKKKLTKFQLKKLERIEANRKLRQNEVAESHGLQTRNIFLEEVKK